MKLTNLILENYIGIYNGLNLKRIEIDFTKCLHRIIMIVGDNGSGKSTILRALNPLPDSNINFIPNKSARKVISYVDEFTGTEYIIEYIHAIGSNGKRETTKGYIKKTINRELIELNPNGNVSSCKDILYTELGLDSNFVSLSEIGCENRGLAMKKPSERKQYVNYILNNLDAYNNIYKTLNKRSSIFKSMINSITTKLTNLGDPEMIRNSLVSLNNRISSMNIERDAIIQSIAEDKARITSLDKDGLIQSKAAEISSDLSSYKSEEVVLCNSIDSLISKFNIDKTKISTLLKQVSDELVSEEIAIGTLESEINNLIKSREEDSKAIIEKQAKLDKLNSDEHYAKIQEEYEKTKANIEKYEDIISKMNLTNKSITSAELVAGVTSLMNIKESIGILKSNFDYNTTEKVLNGEYENINIYLSEIAELDKRLNSIDRELENISGQLEILSILEQRPSECKIDSCPFISKALSIVPLNLDKKYDELVKERESIENDLKVKNDIVTNLKVIEKCKQYVDNIINNIYPVRNILLKLPSGEIFSDVNLLFKKLFDGLDFKEIDLLYSYIDMANVLDMYNESKIYLSNLENDLKSYEYKKYIIEEILNDIEALNKSLTELINKIESHNLDIKKHKDRRDVLSEQKLAFESVEKSLERLEEINSSKDELRKKYDQIEEDILTINSLLSNISINESKLSNINNDLTPMLADRDKLVHALSLVDEYNAELQEYNAKYDKVETIKYYSSPTSGIQLIFLSLYMNKILTLSNDLLSLMFNDELKILPFIINEKEFRIPCTSGGLPSDDITSMSNSQICMISTVIQFALLYQSSTKLNIPRMDEIDSGLDSYNRSRFIVFLDELMCKLNINQAVIISHTSEILDTDVDVILLKNENSKKEITGNIIFDYNIMQR